MGSPSFSMLITFQVVFQLIKRFADRHWAEIKMVGQLCEDQFLIGAILACQDSIPDLFIRKVRFRKVQNFLLVNFDI